MALVVTKSMWVDWKNHPVTVEFLQRLVEQRRGVAEELVEGKTSTEREDREIVGRCQALKDVILYATEDFEIIKEDDDDN